MFGLQVGFVGYWDFSLRTSNTSLATLNRITHATFSISII